MLQKENILTYDAWYPVDMKRRYTEQVPHQQLNNLFTQTHQKTLASLKMINKYGFFFNTIPIETQDEISPAWNNGYLPFLDAMSLYAFIAEIKPKTYYEIGSGNSTKFAKKAIEDNKLNTKIVSIDPHPRSEITSLCNTSIRNGLESVDPCMFEEVQPGDVLFYDGSHRIFQNSDCTVFFLDVLPRLAPNVLIGIHDIFLPYDYYDPIVTRYYNEQYLLASILLFSSAFEIILPSYFASCQKDSSDIMNVYNPAPQIGKVNGCTFWLRTQK